MAVSAETGRLRLTGILIAFLCLGAVLFLGSCRFQEVYVLSDPYIEEIGEGTWTPASRTFRIAAWFHRMTVYQGVMEDSASLRTSFAEVIPVGSTVVLSPLNAMDLGGVDVNSYRIIVAGGEGANPNLEYLVPDRIDAVGELGRVIASGDSDKVFGLFDTSTESRQRELSAFYTAYRDAGGLPEGMESLDLADSPGNRLPEDLERRLDSFDLLVLLAGRQNLAAIQNSDASGILLAGEYLKSSGVREDRILASLEDDPRALRRALIEMLTGEREKGPVFYPEVVIQQ